MTQFDELDAVAASSVDTMLGEPCLWRPMVAPEVPYTIPPGGNPDPARPPQWVSCIVSWQALGLPLAAGVVSAQGMLQQAGVVTEASVMLDFEADVFETEETVEYGKPRKGDRFELPEQHEGEQLFEVVRIGDDGSARFYAWCRLLEE